MEHNHWQSLPPETAHPEGAAAWQPDLRRAIHKVAWTRMLGRNDAENPFARTGGDKAGQEERRPD